MGCSMDIVSSLRCTVGVSPASVPATVPIMAAPSVPAIASAPDVTELTPVSVPAVPSVPQPHRLTQKTNINATISRDVCFLIIVDKYIILCPLHIDIQLLPKNYAQFHLNAPGQPDCRKHNPELSENIYSSPWQFFHIPALIL